MSSPPPAWTLELPAALLHVWPRASDTAWEGPIARLAAAVGPSSGVYRLRRGLLAVVPIAGEPAILDTAVSYGRLLAAEAVEHLTGAAAEASLLVAPGAVRIAGGAAELLPDPFLDDLDDLAGHPAELAANQVHLTGRAAQVLERPREVLAAGTYSGPSGRAVPLFVAGDASPSTRLWRNPEILGRQLRKVERPALERALAAAAGEPVVRITGAMGAGKTRLALETLAASPGTVLCAAVPPARAAELTLEMQIVDRWLSLDGDAERVAREARIRSLTAVRRRLLEGPRADTAGEPQQLSKLLLRGAERCRAGGMGPLTLVCDDLERGSGEDFALLTSLIEATRPGALHLVLVGRSGTPWPAGWEAIPTVGVPPLSPAESEQMADQPFAGLSTPTAVRERFLAAAAGNPFFLEEGLAELIHRKQVRRVYGSFFFSGDDDTEFIPSPRLVAHVDAEIGRLGPATPLRVLALAGGAAPVAELRSAAALVDPQGDAGTPGWTAPYLATGLLVDAESPWGPGVAFAHPAVSVALARTVGDAAAASARHTLGELVAGLAADATARWQSHHLLAGTPEGIDVLLLLAGDAAAAGGHRSEPPAVADGDLLTALGRELTALRERSGGGEPELAILLGLIPLALRLGRLESLEEEIARALELAAARSDPATRLTVSRFKADLDRRHGRLAGAEETLRAALKSAGTADQEGKTALLLQLGRLLIEQRRQDEAEKLFRHILESTTEGDRAVDPRLAATCHFYLGNLALQRNRLTAAGEHHRSALAERRRLDGEPKSLIASLTALGAVCLRSGLYSESLAHYREAEQTTRAIGDEVELAFVLLGAGRALGRLGDFAAASAPLRQALALRARSGDRLGEAMTRLAVAENYLDLELHRDALREAREAHFQLSLLGDTAPIADADQLLGRILLSRRRNAVARGHLLRAFASHRDRGDLVAAAHDRGWLLDEALIAERVDDVFLLIHALIDFLDQVEYPELGERLDHRLFRALTWMRQRGEQVADPLAHLRRGYAALLRKAGHLEPEQRQRFLSQVAENQAILTAGSRKKLESEPAAQAR